MIIILTYKEIMGNKSWIKYFSLISAIVTLSKGLCPVPLPVANGDVLPLIMGQFAIHYCQTGYAFSTNDTAISSECTGNTWTAVNAACATASSYQQRPECSATNPSPPNNTVEMNTTTPVSTFAKVYQCMNDLQWLSGELLRISQCVNGNWSSILDICDVACPIPRHCADVSALGLTGTGHFYVIPSGIPFGQIYMVYCELNSTGDNNGGNWTYIFKSNSISFSYPQRNYSTGINLANYTLNTSYFIGLNFLSNVSLPLPDDPAGMVLEVLFKNALGQNILYATYNNFTVGSAATNFSITSLGKYHGTAGDALCPQLGTSFMFDSATAVGAYWWGALSSEVATTVAGYNGSFLTAGSVWKTLNSSIDITGAVMRIRPTVEDNDVLCPPMVGTEYWWKTTNASIPYSRTPNTTISWQCIGPYMEEGKVGGQRTFNGTSTCLAGSPPTWSYNITLPCTMSCPSPFVVSVDARVCFYYSNDTASNITDAAMKCSSVGGYLAVIANNTDFLVASNSTSYYTAFAARGSKPSLLMPPLPTTVLDNCSNSAVCQTDEFNQCTVIQSPNQYKFVPCSESHNYMCQLQSYCPNSTYQPIGGRCLKFFSNINSLSAAALACSAEGASLVYPTTILEASSISMFVHMNATTLSTDASAPPAPKTYFIGTNNYNGDWTAGGSFTMGDLLPMLATDPVKYWRTMTVYPNMSYSFTPIDVNAVLSDTSAVCSLFGPLGCSEFCPSVGLNMFLVDSSGNATTQGATVTYQCYPGYFFDTNATINVLNSTCSGMLGGSSGWIPSVIPDCNPYPVCDNSDLTVESLLLTNSTVDPDSYYLYGTINFTCPSGMGYITNATSMNTTCQGNMSTGYVFNPATIPACNACIGAISVQNATTNWTTENTTFVTVNQTVAATCIPGYEVTLGVTVQNITCTPTGWNLTEIQRCFQACTGSPPTVLATDNVTAPNVTSNKLTTVLTYNCTPEYSFLVSVNYTTVTNQATVTCNGSGVWVPSRSPLQCAQQCLSNPPEAPANVTSSWDGISRNINLQVVYTASNGTLFGNYSNTWTIFCNGSVWLPIDNSSTSPTGNGMLEAKKACLLSPPTNIGGALPVNWTATAKGFSGQNLTYSCPVGQATKTGLNSTMLTCSSVYFNWTAPPTSFLCVNACAGPPPLAPTLPATATYNYSGDFTEGIVVTYQCPGGFSGGLGKTINSTCTGGNWTVYTIPKCLTVTTPRPTTTPPIIIPVAGSSLYQDTASLHFGNLQNFTSAKNFSPSYSIVSSLVGFGMAIGLNASQSQCVVQQHFANANQPCQSNPKSCPNGFSISIWTRVFFSINATEDISNYSDEDNQIFLSTGADKTGYPGVVLGVRKIWLFGLVSTGDHYWEVNVLGPLENNTWNNVGLTWNLTGLSVFVNSTQVGSTTVSYPSTAKPGFSPPLLMVGCSKTPDSAEYSGYATADVDEVALWTTCLNSTTQSDFMGGYSANVSAITPAEFNTMIKKVLLNDLGQQAAAVAILQTMSANEEASPTATSATVTSTASGVTSTAATAAASTASASSLQVIAEIAMSMLDVNKVPTSITPLESESFMGIAQPISNLIDPSNTQAWLQIQNKTESVGVIQTIASFAKWQAKLVQSITFTSNSTIYCNEKALQNLYFKYCKMTVQDLIAIAMRIQLPDYTDPTLQQLRNMWQDTLTDRVAIPTNVFSDSRCNERPVTFIFNYFNSDAKAVANFVNPMYLDPTSLNAVDSRLMYADLIVDPPTDSTGALDPSLPLCTADTELLRTHTVLVRVTHSVVLPQIVKLRKLTGIFDNVTETNILERHCVFWNENLTDYGAWDDNGCAMLSTNAEYSKCSCSSFGVFGILAAVTPPKVVPPEPSWLAFPKYILYLLSVIALSLYIIVVMLSGELKDQFHLIGLNLAVAILIGSITMVFSGLQAVTLNRNMCTLFGTLIHLFYGGVGAWMLGLGHSSFRAITSGVIGGMLKVYMFLCWGLSIAFVGIPFIWLLTDLGTDPRCFIGWMNEVKWVFFILQMTYSFLALFFAIVVFCNLSTPALRKDNLIEDYCSFCRGAAFLILYLALTWTFGMFTYIRFSFTQMNFYPLFQILNSLSGIWLFVCIGLGSNRFRSVLARKTAERHEKLRTFAFGYPEETAKSNRLTKPDGQVSNTASTSDLVPPNMATKYE